MDVVTAELLLEWLLGATGGVWNCPSSSRDKCDVIDVVAVVVLDSVVAVFLTATTSRSLRTSSDKLPELVFPVVLL